MGILLIFSGIILLLNNFNFLPWSVWGMFFRLWPVFLVISGLEMLSEDFFLGRFLVKLIILTGVLFVFIQALLINPQFRFFFADHFPWFPDMRWFIESVEKDFYRL